MQTPTAEHSSEVLVGLGTYNAARLGADERTAELRGLVVTRTDDLRAKLRARQDAQHAAVAASALADAADEQLDRDIRALSDAAYNAAGRRRDVPAFARLFPGGVTRYTQARLADQVEAAESLLRHLANVADDPRVVEHRPRIEASLERLKTAMAGVVEAQKAVEIARSQEVLSRMAFVATYVSTYGAVVQALGSKAAAEPFFRRFRSSHAPTDVEADVPAPEAATVAPAVA